MQSCCVCLHRITARETFPNAHKTHEIKTYAFSRELFFTQWQQQKSLKRECSQSAREQISLKNKIQNIWATACATSDATHGRGQSILKETRNPIGACVSLDSFKSRLRGSKSQRRMCDSERFPGPVTINEESSLSPIFSSRFRLTLPPPAELSLASGSSSLSSTRHSVKLARKLFDRCCF